MHIHVHICVHAHNIICVFSERDLLNYLHPELSNWYQVFKWGQMSSSMLLSLALSLYHDIWSYSAAISMNLNV